MDIKEGDESRYFPSYGGKTHPPPLLYGYDASNNNNNNNPSPQQDEDQEMSLSKHPSNQEGVESFWEPIKRMALPKLKLLSLRRSGSRSHWPQEKIKRALTDIKGVISEFKENPPEDIELINDNQNELAILVAETVLDNFNSPRYITPKFS